MSTSSRSGGIAPPAAALGPAVRELTSPPLPMILNKNIRIARTNPLLSGRINRARNMRYVIAVPSPVPPSLRSPGLVEADGADAELARVLDCGSPGAMPRRDGMVVTEGVQRRARRASECCPGWATVVDDTGMARFSSNPACWHTSSSI